jgi:serine/threonine protein kinase
VSKEDLRFAVKELQAVDGSAKAPTGKEDSEAVALKQHLIRLLATFRHQGRFHLIFPWADGNLKDLWTSPFYQPSSRPRDKSLIRWMSSQILGLVCALEKIHWCPVKNTGIQDLPPDVERREHGRHGDLKPENILWFEEGLCATAVAGTLKIADFGFADFHARHSRSAVRRSTIGGCTETYKAPEYDISQWISPQYDIWSLGCILLQFAVWYLRGWQGVEDFTDARIADSKATPIKVDTFFGLEEHKPICFKARAKESVMKVSTLSCI